MFIQIKMGFNYLVIWILEGIPMLVAKQSRALVFYVKSRAHCCIVLWHTSLGISVEKSKF